LTAPPKPVLVPDNISREDSMTQQQAIREAREHTCACWWPSKAFPRRFPDYQAVGGELQALLEGERERAQVVTVGDGGQQQAVTRKAAAHLTEIIAALKGEHDIIIS
jgi:hypothetical protein